MASTNKTANYNLSQYIGTDKPTYLSDYNTDMYNIDAQMKVNADNVATAISGIETATTTANTANTNAQTAISTANSASSTASEASTTATNAQTTANSALATATTAQSTANTANATANTANTNANKALEDLTKFNLTTYKTYATNEFTIDGTGSVTFSNLTLATNSDSSIFKLYGEIHCTGFVNSVSISTTLRPDDGYTIICAGIDSNMYTRNISVATNGTINLGLGFSSDRNAYYWPCLYFNKNFGDEPAPSND